MGKNIFSYLQCNPYLIFHFAQRLLVALLNAVAYDGEPIVEEKAPKSSLQLLFAHLLNFQMQKVTINISWDFRTCTCIAGGV